MAYKAPDYNNLIALFNKYIKSPKTKVPSLVGFKAFMLTEQNYPAWMVKALYKQIMKDVDLKFHLNAVVEANLVEGALTGLYKGDAAKFILKNNHSYSDTAKSGSSEGTTVKQVVFKAAQPPKALGSPDE